MVKTRDLSTECMDCGERWETPPTFAVPCPKCGAKAGHPCIVRRPSGHAHNAGFGNLHPWGHAEREQLALDRGLIRACAKAKAAQEQLQLTGVG